MTTWDSQSEYATNLLPYSEDFTKWISTSVSLQPGQADPFGLNSAVRLTDTSEAVFGQTRYNLNIDGTVTRVFSCFVMKDSDTTRVPSIRMIYTGSISATLRLNTYTGEVTPVAGTGVNLVNYGVVDCDSAWRIYVASNKDTLVSVGLLPANAASLSAAGSAALTGAATFYGAQLQVGSSPTGLIKTNGESVTALKLDNWANKTDLSTSWGSQSNQTEAWAKMITAGYVELGYVDYIYVEGDLISYAVDDVNNTWTEQTDATTTWQ